MPWVGFEPVLPEFGDFIALTSTITRQPFQCIQIHSHIFTCTQGGGRDFKSLERPGWDSNPCSQSLVTSALDHYATTTPQRRQSLKALNLERYFHGKCFVDLTTAKSCLLEQQSTEWLKLVDSKPKMKIL